MSADGASGVLYSEMQPNLSFPNLVIFVIWAVGAGLAYASYSSGLVWECVWIVVGAFVLALAAASSSRV